MENGDTHALIRRVKRYDALGRLRPCPRNNACLLQSTANSPIQLRKQSLRLLVVEGRETEGLFDVRKPRASLIPNELLPRATQKARNLRLRVAETGAI